MIRILNLDFYTGLRQLGRTNGKEESCCVLLHWMCRATAKLTLAAVLLGTLAPSVLAEEQTSTAKRIAENFLEEVLEEGGIKKIGERLGYSGSEKLKLDRLTAEDYELFVKKLSAKPHIKVVPEDRILANDVYKTLLRGQSALPAELNRSLARDILESRPRRARQPGIDGGKPLTIAVVTFTSFNGARGLVYGAPGLRLVKNNPKDMSALAKGLGVDYVVSVKLAPSISKFDPMGAKPGTTSVWYRARVYDSQGQVAFDERNPGDELHPLPVIRFVGYELSFMERLGMGLAKVIFLFPTDAQAKALEEMEERLMRETLMKTSDQIADRVLAPR